MNGPGLGAIAAALQAAGLVALGAFHPEASDGVPPLADGRPCGTLVLAGNVGGSLWPAFSAAPEAGDGRPDPLDRWSARVLGGLAADFGGTALFPFGGPPYLPFQRWARRGAPLGQSPLGMLIHPVYGLWHAYRGAIALSEVLPLVAPDPFTSPCETCSDRPCLKTCPVGAFTGTSYDVTACAGHVASSQGADCLEFGCRARRACPVGQAHHYPAAQARFHTAAFLAAHGFSRDAG